MPPSAPRTAHARATDIGLRVAGVGLIALAWAAVDTLVARHRHHPGGAPDMLAYLLAAVVFIAGGVGAVLALLGEHIFDEVEVSPRWARHGTPRDRR